DDVLLVQWNREEQSVVSSTTFSPPPPTLTDSLCWEANVIIIANTSGTQGVLLSKTSTSLVTNFTNGWIDLGFLPPSITAPRHELSGGNTIRTNTATGVSTTQTSATYNGLPIVGFAAQYFNNGTLTVPGQQGVQAFYTGSFLHKYTRLIQ